MENSHIDSLVSLAEAARRLGVHSCTVRRWIAGGKVEGFWVGQHLKVKSGDLARLVRPVKQSENQNDER